jgi:hypothetical protein
MSAASVVEQERSKYAAVAASPRSGSQAEIIARHDVNDHAASVPVSALKA